MRAELDRGEKYRRASVGAWPHLQQGLWARLGYREEWADERPNRNVRRFSFRSVGLTIHFGRDCATSSAWSTKCYMNMLPLYQPQLMQTEAVA